MAVFNESKVLQINDLTFTCGAGSIQIQKENLSYKYHVLRSDSSTKVPTAHGGCLVTINIPIPVEDILKLHRLIIQIRNNPFCYIENKYIREEIVPIWPSHQNMAFTAIALNVESVPGNVGLFNCILQLQWFNYFPVTHNFLFREEWETQWIPTQQLDEDEVENTLIGMSFDKDNRAFSDTKWVKKSIFKYITQWSEDEPSDGHTYETAGNLNKTLDHWEGFIFDLLPLTVGMEKAAAVNNPRNSKIYVRYYNEMQRLSLMTNFGIDVSSYSYLGEHKYYYEVLSGFGGNHKDQPTLPEILSINGLSGQVIAKMVSHDSFIFTFNIYKYIDLPKSMKEALNIKTNELITNGAFVTQNTSNEDVPVIIKEHVAAWERLTRVNPSFRQIIYPLIQKLIDGETLSGKAYQIGGSQLEINSAWRPNDSGKHGITVDGIPDAHAIDLGLIGSDLEYLNTEESIDYQNNYSAYQRDLEIITFFMDLGYLVNTEFKSSLTWGGEFSSSAKKQSNSLTEADRARNEHNEKRDSRVKTTMNSFVPVILGNYFQQGKDTDSIRKTIWPKGFFGVDPVHIEIKDSVLGESALQAGKRLEVDSKGNPVVNNMFANPPKDIDPWYTMFDKLSDLTDEDLVFFNQLDADIKNGYQYYSKDPAVNGVLFKPITITIPGHGPFNGESDSHNTILTRISGTLKHIVVALPIQGHEFPTHQHLGSTDPDYSFEFMSVDNHGDRSGIGNGAKLLETARITLQQNGRNIRNIFDSWTAKTDNFITRLFGTYDHYGPDLKKLVIDNVNSQTIEGNPGLSVTRLECSETLTILNEKLTKVTSSTKKDFESVYKKIVSKYKEITKRADNLPLLQTLKDAQNNINNNYKNSSDLALRAFSIFGGHEDIIDTFTLDLFDTNFSKNPVKEIGVDFYVVDENLVSDLTNEEKQKLDALVLKVSNYIATGELILFESEFGGLPSKSNGSIDHNLFGLEDLLIMRGDDFLSYSINRQGTFTKNLFQVVTEYNLDSFFDISTTITNTENELLGNNTKLPYIDLFDPSKEIAPGLQLLITTGYLLELNEFTGNLELAFLSSTSDALLSIINNNIFPTPIDGSPLLNERFGLVSSIRKSLYNSFFNSSLGKVTELDWEKNKIELIKDSIISVFREALNDPFLLEYFGITSDVADLLNKIERDEKDALPDLQLPEHPFWNKTYLTPPDFFYFNYHEDGMYTSDGYNTYNSLSDRYVDGIYSWMDAWVRKGIVLDISGNNSAGEVSESGQRDLYFNPDGYDHDNTNSPDLKKKGINSHGFTGPAGETDSLQFFSNETNTNGRKIAHPFQASLFDRDALYVPLSNKDLIKEIQNVRFEFGKKEGYANEREEIAKVFPDSSTGLSDPADTFTHFFGKQDLQSIVKESKKDILSQKFTMKRAFPTFRIYLVEEDQSEDSLFRYDDFYHYNAIKEINIVRSRKVAGDTAVIVMQNVAGLLDGSKKNVLKDTDFLTKQVTATGSLTAKGKEIDNSRSLSNLETEAEEKIGSIVLRPGVNMQIRIGVGNDPNNLEVKLTGRIVDIMYSENSDLVEITVQSFGVELEQVEKGLDPNESNTYILTHKLLGALMMSPELVHFGRWETSIQPQEGEAKDSKLDFRKYSSNLYYQKLTSVYFQNTSEAISNIYADATNAASQNLSLAKYGPTGGVLALANSSVKSIGIGADMAKLGISANWDAIKFGYANTKQKLFARIQNQVTERTSYALNTPQDDNLFPPNPKDYILRPNWGWKYIKDIGKAIYKADGLTERLISGFSTAISEGFRLFISQRMDTDDLIYVLDRTTIWKVFEEMTFRHPGYVFGPMPYGKSFRYTMFFGVPSQRYWSKPAHPWFISRVNHLSKALSSTINSESNTASSDNFKQTGYLGAFANTYGISDFLKVVNNNVNKWRFGESTMGVVDDLEARNQLLKKLGVSSEREALLEYYLALTLRFEPYRRYHMATSETDIISNNMSVSEYNVANAVAVKYYANSTDPETNIVSREQEDIVLVKTHDRLPDEEIKLTSLDYPNIGSKLLALRYGVAQLMYEAKNMYSGSILLYGNPRIKCNDIIYIVDKVTDICGPVEVEQVVEKFSFETGYITEIKPNAVVMANEISSFPILEGLKAFVSARTAEQDALYSTYTGNEFFNKVATAGFSQIESFEDIFNLDVLNRRNVQGLSSALQEDINKVVGIPNSSSFMPSNSITMSLAWMIGGYFYTFKCLEGQSIIVYPLLKNGLPMLAGLPAAQPETLWSITLGQVNSFITDVNRGTTEFLSRWKLTGMQTISAFVNSANLNQQITSSTDQG